MGDGEGDGKGDKDYISNCRAANGTQLAVDYTYMKVGFVSNREYEKVLRRLEIHIQRIVAR